MLKNPYSVVLIIPTGIGASIGGYAGDALPVARAISTISDRLITHPNVMNGAQLYWSSNNIFYVEGYGLDKFASGEWGLQPVHQNRIGLILDQSIEAELRLRHLQVADATRATLGLDIAPYIITDQPLKVELRTAPSGASWGTIANSDSLLRSAEKLITQAGVKAIAVVARFPDDIDTDVLTNYRHGTGVDPLAGAEAVISHLIVRQFRIPTAHAPALQPLKIDAHISPRSAAEELGYTFLPSVLVGLSKAPQFTLNKNYHTIWSEEIDALIIPKNACGGSATLSFSETKTQIIVVENNQTTMKVPPEALGIQAIRVQSYLEALGVLVAHRSGISIDCFSPELLPLRSLN